MSFDTAVSGIKASSTSLGIIGNNIANAGTSGFKSSRGEFADVYASSLLGTSSKGIGSGVSISGVNQSFSQGNISFTDNVMDMAINGSGFFVLNDDGTNVYSRAGNFQVDRNGNVVNSLGNRLMVFNTTEDGVLTGGMGELQIDTSLIQPRPTSTIDMGANLDSRATVPITAWPAGGFDAFAAPPTAPTPEMFNSSTSVTIYDSLGNSHVQSLYFVKTTNQNEWNVYSLIDGVSSTGPDTLTFDSSGQIPAASKPLQVSTAAWSPLGEDGLANGATTQSFTLDLSDISQFGSDFSVSNINQNGFTTGQLRGVEVDESGIVFARFTNGQARAMGQVALANFSNTSGLQPLGGTSWSETFSSGQPTLSSPGTGGLGVVQSGALEDSNVEVTEQLVDMIVAQRNFQANAKVIQTEDTITQAIINLR
ncbi:MAG: flagellar hook protein FlgE [SAR86 cluster bacterium]|uniref:Flagellar hook protein FlgE n=1 Tax=SAR86 cluster bacterium TaxID=2030880 RepID=A0A2A5CBE3_9GAMM|nr:MAG: flagellar hook protein FlgE [SAR86 cluster bacterium]